jgi:diaminopimelate decarboxylase
VFKSNFLTQTEADELAARLGTPLFIYSRKQLREQARSLRDLELPFGFTPRFAMKANPHPDVLAIFREQGIAIDASSSFEAGKAMAAGYRPSDILLTSQQLPESLEELVQAGVQFNATSLHQLEKYGQAFPNSAVSVRLNPGIGSGHSVKTNVGGVTSSFGIWHEYVPQIHELAERYHLTIDRVHTHIGSGSDPAVWEEAAQISLELIKNFPDASIINLGGGFKVARMDEEQGTHATDIAAAIGQELQLFEQTTGRKLKLELEPGTWLVANAGILLAGVADITDTGPEGYTFLKLDTGMNDILRPSLYGAQHPVAVLNSSEEIKEYVVVGHNCESGDLLTPAPGNPEILGPRCLNQAMIGDLVLVGGTGAYCATMAAHGYNSFPNATEILI